MTDEIEGVTAHGVAALRDIAAFGRYGYNDVLAALRMALRYYDLVNKAWLGTREEYNEELKRLRAVLLDDNVAPYRKLCRIATLLDLPWPSADAAAAAAAPEHTAPDDTSDVALIDGLSDSLTAATARAEAAEQRHTEYLIQDLARHTELESEAAALRARVDELEQLAEQRAVDIAALLAELRNYEPSDGVMQQRLAMTDAIREVAPLVEAYVNEQSGWQTPVDEKARAWLALPVVKAARGP